MLSFALLGSGSSGNAILVETDQTRLLIDNGLSYKELSRRALTLGLGLDRLDGVLLTHEHGDHCAGIGTLARKHGIPVYLTQGTHQSLPAKVGALPQIRTFRAGDTWQSGDLHVDSFSISHDAADPVGFTLSANGAKVGFAFDMGSTTKLVRHRLAACHALVVESNYCPELLDFGDYPESIKQRIRSRFGHLSNDAAAELIREVAHPGLSTIVLVHISENNNTPERARAAVSSVLDGHPVSLHLATQDAPTPWFRVKA